MAAAMCLEVISPNKHFTCKNIFLVLCFFTYLLGGIYVNAVEVSRPRGVPLAKKPFYDPSRDFNCIDGSHVIPFAFVNDDYCDCSDGSDEPGTAACPNGIFHCSNAGHVSQDIPSSRVNDGLCDCCDASDEYNSTADCTNNCFELGEKAREEEKKRQELLMRGYELRLQLSKEGKEKKAENRENVEKLKKELEEVGKTKNDLEALKKEAEEKENQALQKYRDEEDQKKKEQEEIEMLKSQQEERSNAEDAFDFLDTNQDGILQYQELQEHTIFDQNKDGTVSEEEAKFFLHMKEEMELEEFVTTGWMIMKPIYMMTKVTPPPPVEDDVTPPPTVSEEESEKELEDEVEQLPEEGDPSQDPDEDDDLEEEPPVFPPKDETTEEKEEEKKTDDPKYDPETQALIDAARTARDNFNAAEERYRNLETQLRKLETMLETDFGPDEEYAAFRDQCFEYTDREYTYKFCPFDKATQRPKSGGSETSLGRWGSWQGTDDNKYAKMKLDGGMSCWNGPSRSVVINIHCGLENQLTSASEPSRCEYMFDFNTPAACISPTTQPHHPHTEL